MIQFIISAIFTSMIYTIEWDMFLSKEYYYENNIKLCYNKNNCTDNFNDKQLAKLRNESIGFVFQSYNLIQRTTVIKNIEMPAVIKGTSKSERKKKTLELLEMLDISDQGKKKPNALSGGQQQRVAIARALVNNPTYILADEPTGNLDTKTGNEIFKILKKLSKEMGTTILVVTHDLDIAKLTDRTIKLKDGLIIN